MSECTGAYDCPAQKHIHGCYNEKPLAKLGRKKRAGLCFVIQCNEPAQWDFFERNAIRPSFSVCDEHVETGEQMLDVLKRMQDWTPDE